MEPKQPSEHTPVARPVAVPKAVPTAVPVAGVAQMVQVIEAAPTHTLEHVDEYLRKGQESDASDVHLAVNCKPSWRRNGILEPIWLQANLMTAQDTERLAVGFLNEAQRKRLFEIGDVDFAYATGLGRFRASVVRHRLGIDMSFRIINTKLRTMDDLGLPDGLKMLTQYNNGLILVTGSVGSGKSTTLAAMVDYVNETRHDHIITLEDPVEYVIPSKNCHVTQREVHTHTRGFSQALRGALREDPDVIMVGEMRDLETIQLAITASETGHLVLATLHTGSAARTLDRILDVFPADQREQIRVMVSESLRGIISQQLVPRADRGGRVLALEVLLRTEAVAACIRDGKTFMLPGVMQTGGKMGMRLMDDSLFQLFQEGLISEEECYQRSEQKVVMRQHLLAHKK
jgi:twitching motility protein PilT